MHGDIGHAKFLQLLKNTEVNGRLELELNRKSGALRDGLGALPEIENAFIAVDCRAARERNMRNTIKTLRGLCHLGELLRRFLRYRGASLQAASESAETAARLGTGVAQAGLQDCGCEAVIAVQQGDLLIGNAIRRLQIVKFRLSDKARGNVFAILAVETAAVFMMFHIIGIGTVDDIKKNAASIEKKSPGIRGAGSAAAPWFNGISAYPADLKIHQLFKRQTHSVPSFNARPGRAV